MSYLWVLVEWVDENSAFPSYSVVHVDPMMYGNELSAGRVIPIRLRHEGVRRGRIIDISDNIQFVKAHKKMLERKDKQMKNVISMCMRTIKGIQAEPVYSGGLDMSAMNMNSTFGMMSPRGVLPSPPIITADTEPSTSDESDEMMIKKPRRDIKPNFLSRPSSALAPHFDHFRRMDAMTNGRLSAASMHHAERMMSSTPLPRNPEDRVLMFDQATQTEDDTYEQLEPLLKKLYAKFLNIAARFNFHNSPEGQLVNHGWMAMIRNRRDVVNMPLSQILEEMGPSTSAQADEVANQVSALRVNHTMNTSDSNTDDNTVSGEVRVRRVSAQTTNNIENDMVQIGSGHAVVPARLMNEIDWTCYTSATRQLLQAIFPRKVLATHSLTGKQSPAFQDKPAKKCLDPKLVEDIVETVAQRCGVEKRLVRSVITIKCTDEAKLYRNRLHYRLTRAEARHNEENTPPTGTSSDDSSLFTN